MTVIWHAAVRRGCMHMLTECQCLAHGLRRPWSGHAVVIDNDGCGLARHRAGRRLFDSPAAKYLAKSTTASSSHTNRDLYHSQECHFKWLWVPAVTKRNIQTRSIARSLYDRQLSFLSCRPCCYTRSKLLNQRRNAPKYEILTPN